MGRKAFVNLLVWLLVGSIASSGSVRQSNGPDKGSVVRSVNPAEIAAIQDALYRLHFDEALKLSTQMIQKYPDNPSGLALVSLVRWNQLLQKAGNLALDDYATPSPFRGEKTQKPIRDELNRFHSATRNLVEFCEKARQKNSRDNLALYFLGFAEENRAAENLAILKDRGSGISAGKRACSYHEELLKRAPQFVDAKMSLATREFAQATLPWTIKWIAFLIGASGSKEKAFNMLDEISRHGLYRKLDARVVTALLQAWRGDPRESIRIFKELSQQYPENYLLDINMAAIFETVLDDPRSALKIYQDLLENLDQKADGIRAGEILMRTGKTYHKLNENSLAKKAFEKALSAQAAEMETPYLCHYYLGRIAEEQREDESVREHFSAVLKYPGPKKTLKEELEYSRKRIR